MIDLIQQTEALPQAFPPVPDGLSPEATALDPAMIWGRIETYTAVRFTPREVVWIVEADGEAMWKPPLGPAVSAAAERWDGSVWVLVALPPAPMGLSLPRAGMFQITAQVGAGPVPAAVSEAFRRLAEYMADDAGRAGASAEIEKIDVIETELQRSPTWLARAMQNSGAADLLRQYRKV